MLDLFIHHFSFPKRLQGPRRRVKHLCDPEQLQDEDKTLQETTEDFPDLNNQAFLIGNDDYLCINIFASIMLSFASKTHNFEGFGVLVLSHVEMMFVTKRLRAPPGRKILQR